MKKKFIKTPSLYAFLREAIHGETVRSLQACHVSARLSKRI